MIKKKDSQSNVLDNQLIHDKAEEALSEIIDNYTTVDTKTLNKVQMGLMPKETFFKEAERFLDNRKFDKDLIPVVLENLERFLWGYYILEDLINDPGISDIKVLAYDNVRIKRKGKRMDAGIRFKDDKDYKRFVNLVAVKNKISLSNINAMQEFTDKESNKDYILRFNISTEFVNSVNNPYLQIRKHPKTKLAIEDLILENMLDRETADYLIDKAKNGKGIFFTGANAAGKTTLMNALIEYIPHDCSGLVIQVSEELFSYTHPELMFKHTVSTGGEGKINYGLKELTISGLTADIDYFIIGEIKGPEAKYFLNASYTGSKCWGSGHGDSAYEAIDKLVDYAKDESDYSKEQLLKMLKNMSTIIFMENYKVKEIAEVVGWDEEVKNLKYKTVLSDSVKDLGIEHHDKRNLKGVTR